MAASKLNEKQINCMRIYWKNKLIQQYFDNNGYLFNCILSEVAQEHNKNSDPSIRHSTPQKGLKHTHRRPNARHGTHYTNIAVASLTTIKPYGMRARTSSRYTTPTGQAREAPLDHSGKRKPNIP